MEQQFAYPHLFTPWKVGSVTIKNRYVMAPMGAEQLYGTKGEFTDLACDYFCERARSGFGLLMTGGRWTDNDIDQFTRPSVLTDPWWFQRHGLHLTDRVHAYGAKMFVQVSLGLGRNAAGCCTASGTPNMVRPKEMTRALTTDEIKRKIENVVNAAALMKKCNFDGVEVHSLHGGHLLDLLALSLTNQREDEYGGSLENRLRACREIVEGIKQVCGSNFPVSIRIALKSFMKGLHQPTLYGEEEAGRTLEEGLEIARLLESYGYDMLNVDVGEPDSSFWIQPTIYSKRGTWLEFSEKAKQVVSIPVICGGWLHDPKLAEEAVADGKVDAVILGRASLADPAIVQKIATGNEASVRPCIGCYMGCLGKVFSGAETSCAVNPAAGRPKEYALQKTTEPKRVFVVGGGVAGMEAARVCALRGHDVSIFEKSDHLGGLLVPAGTHEFKRDIARLNTWYQHELQKLNVPVHLNTNVTPEFIRQDVPDVVLLAVGSRPVVPPLPGIQDEKVCTAVDALERHLPLGQRIVIIGGGLVGCESAIDFAQQGKDVAIVEMMPELLPGGKTPNMVSQHIHALLDDLHVRQLTGTKLLSVTKEGVQIAPASGGDVQTLAADSVVLSIGMRPLESMAASLYGCGAEVFEIGDGRAARDILSAVWDAYEVARAL